MRRYLFIPFFTFMTLSSLVPLAGQQAPSQVEQTAPEQDPFVDQPFRQVDDSLARDAIKEPDDFRLKFMNMLFVLGLLIGFMLLASWMIRRMTRTRVTQLNQSSSIKVLETRYLSPRSTLYLLDVEGERLLIAESPTSVSHLASLGPLQEEDRS